jgi:hypothetical protein
MRARWDGLELVMLRRLLAIAAVGLVSACASAATPYQPSATPGGYGFAETPIETNRVRLSFRGNSLTGRETVETYLLYRAAETTLERGFDHFVVANRATDAEVQRYREPDPFYPTFRPVYYYFHPRYGWRAYYDPFYRTGFWDSPARVREITRYEAVAEIAMFRGSKPAENANAFDAREVVSNLRGRVAAPPPG